MKLEKRVDIKVGFRCNNNCRFCVQANKRNWGNKTTGQIKNDLNDAKKTKCEGVVFTGGEPTIRDDILEIVGYAKKIGFNTIQIQTNGRMLAYMNFCRKLTEAGANEFSPALHGHTAQLHDFLTNSPGSFRQTVQGIKNIKKLNQRVITNTVVTKPNYRHLPEIAKLLIKLDVDQFQFAFVHPIGNAGENFDSIVPNMSLAAPYIHKGLHMGIDAGIRVMAEAMPYCLMQGYEKYVSERYIPPTEIRDAGCNIFDYDERRKTESKMKFPQCKKCGYDKVCEGPWKEYPEKRGNSEFKPVKKMNQVILKIIGNCNNNCRFCMVPMEEKKKRFMPFSEIKKEIDNIKEKDTIIDFFGGEPTIHPQFFKALQYAKDKGFKYTLASNGRLFSYQKMIKKIKKIGVLEIRSSLYGHKKELHESLTRAPGSFEQTIKGFKNIIKQGLPLRVNIVINRENINYLRDIAELLVRIGVKKIKFSGLALSGNMQMKKNKYLIVPFPLIKKHLSKILPDLKTKGINFSIEKLPICLFPEYYDCFVVESDRIPFVKMEECKKCKYEGLCMGIFDDYVREEIKFRPIPQTI